MKKNLSNTSVKNENKWTVHHPAEERVKTKIKSPKIKNITSPMRQSGNVKFVKNRDPIHCFHNKQACERGKCDSN